MYIQALMFGFCAIAVSAQAFAEDRLATLLAYVPSEAAGELADGEYVSFIDLAAMRADSNARTPLFERLAWDPFERQAASVSRVAGGPAMLSEYLQYGALHEFTSTPAYLGFAWQDIDAAIGFYKPPNGVTVLMGDQAMSDAAAVGSVLTGRGYAAEERGGYPFWWHLEDNAIDIEHRNPEDPLRGGLGGSARAGLVDGAFVAAANWQAIDRTLQAHGSDTANLAADPDFTALAYAISQPITGDGLLLQATLMEGSFGAQDVIDVFTDARMSEAVVDQFREYLEPAPGADLTPRYSAFAFADRQEGGEAVGVVALAYDNRTDADTATRTVSSAFAAQLSMAYGQPFSEIIPGSMTSRVVTSPDGTRYIALIAFVTEFAPRQGPMERPQTTYYTLMSMLYQMDMGPLIATDH